MTRGRVGGLLLYKLRASLESPNMVVQNFVDSSSNEVEVRMDRNETECHAGIWSMKTPTGGPYPVRDYPPLENTSLAILRRRLTTLPFAGLPRLSLQNR